MSYNTIYNGFQGTNEVIPGTDPLVAPPAGLGPYTPWSIHATLAGMRPICCWAHNSGFVMKNGVSAHQAGMPITLRRLFVTPVPLWPGFLA